MAGLITEENLGGHVYCRACNGAPASQGVLTEAEVGDDEVFTICADEDVRKLEVAVDEALVGATVGTHSAEAVEVGEGGSDLLHDREDHSDRDGDLPSFVLGEEALKGLVVPVRDDVDEALVFNHLIVLEDSQVKDVKKGDQPTL
eukprot:XP_001706162.1 Hypothetical protein GL50803_104062 [Giardia lamblia ATCC 50803]